MALARILAGNRYPSGAPTVPVSTAPPALSDKCFDKNHTISAYLRVVLKQLVARVTWGGPRVNTRGGAVQKAGRARINRSTAEIT